MRKTLVMGDDREGKHTERDGEPNWEGVFDDIFGKTIFDAVGVVFKSEDEGWEANTGEV